MLAAKPNDAKAPTRVRMEMGGAVGRGNMVPPLAGATPVAPSAPSVPSDNK
jgi:hypothetical protein